MVRRYIIEGVHVNSARKKLIVNKHVLRITYKL
jgi:hypothetical protein